MARQLPISEARRQLPDLVRRAQRGDVVEITVRGEVVARLVAPEAEAGVAAERVLAARRTLARSGTRVGPTDVSSRKNVYLTRPAP